jgi:hypothetical protein
MSQDDTIPPTSPDSRPETSEEAQLALEAVAEARRRLAEAPASVVVANHAMGLFELAAIRQDISHPDHIGQAGACLGQRGLYGS